MDVKVNRLHTWADCIEYHSLPQDLVEALEREYWPFPENSFEDLWGAYTTIVANYTRRGTSLGNALLPEFIMVFNGLKGDERVSYFLEKRTHTSPWQSPPVGDTSAGKPVQQGEVQYWLWAFNLSEMPCLIWTKRFWDASGSFGSKRYFNPYNPSACITNNRA